MMARDPLKAVEAIPRQPLLDLPTPLERVSRLSDALGISLWFKRDDIAGIGAGGNKLRKLELILGEALAEGVTWLITTGGPQSNHARLTAAVAARLVLAVHYSCVARAPQRYPATSCSTTCSGPRSNCSVSALTRWQPRRWRRVPMNSGAVASGQ